MPGRPTGRLPRSERNLPPFPAQPSGIGEVGAEASGSSFLGPGTATPATPALPASPLSAKTLTKPMLI